MASQPEEDHGPVALCMAQRASETYRWGLNHAAYDGYHSGGQRNGQGVLCLSFYPPLGVIVLPPDGERAWSTVTNINQAAWSGTWRNGKPCGMGTWFFADLGEEEEGEGPDHDDFDQLSASHEWRAQAELAVDGVKYRLEARDEDEDDDGTGTSTDTGASTDAGVTTDADDEGGSICQSESC